MNTSTVTPIDQTPKQPQQRQTAKDIIAANVKSLIEQLEAGHSDALTAYLDAMSRVHNYSFGNILEIARQRPSATLSRPSSGDTFRHDTQRISGPPRGKWRI